MKIFCGLGAVAGVLFLFSGVGHAVTYHCKDQTGARILTDNPAQLQECVIIQMDSASQSVDTSRLSGLLETPSPEPDVQTGALPSPEAKLEAPSPEGIAIPLTKIGGSLVVQVQLNQERFAKLILDTGASMTVLSTDLAIELGILGTTDNELMTVNTAGGQVQVNINYLSSLTVGTAEAKHVAVAIHDLPDLPSTIEGLLGMSFLKHFLVTLDAEHGRLILRPREHS